MNTLVLLLAAMSVVEPKATDEALINPGMGLKVNRACPRSP